MSASFSRAVLYRRLLWCTCAVLLLIGIAKWYVRSAGVTGEREALEFVRINGATSESPSHSELTRLLLPVSVNPPQQPWLATPRVAVSFPRDRMTDAMVENLLAIRKLEAVYLYPPAPDGSSVDFAANVLTPVKSLGDLALPLSRSSVERLEERFPDLSISLVDRPNPEPDQELEDGTETLIPPSPGPGS